MFIAFLPIGLFAFIMFAGVCALADYEFVIRAWIHNHYFVLCVVSVLLFAAFLIFEIKACTPTLKKEKANIPLFATCSVLRAAMTEYYFLTVVTDMASSFTNKVSVFSPPLEILGLVMYSLPLFAFLLFEFLLTQLGYGKAAILFSCAISVAATAVGFLCL